MPLGGGASSLTKVFCSIDRRKLSPARRSPKYRCDADVALRKIYVVGTAGTQAYDGVSNEDSDSDCYGDTSSNPGPERSAVMADGLGRGLRRR